MTTAITTAGAPPWEGTPLQRGPRPERTEPGPGDPRPGPDANDALVEGARLARQALGADHASVLLADPLGRLVPAVSVARTEDALLWSRFRAMPPLRIDAIPVPLSIITSPRPIVVNDAESSAIVPEAWRIAFGVRSLAAAPLVSDGVVRGLLVVDFCEQPHEFSESEVRLLEAMAAPLCYLLGVSDVVEAARRRSDLLVRVGAAGRELCAARTRHGVLQTGMAALLDVLGGTECAVHVAAGDGVGTLASRGARQPDPGRHGVADLDEPTRWALHTLDGDAVRPAVVAGRGGEQHVLVPMTDADAAQPAFALVTRERGPELTATDLDVARQVAVQVWQAYERAGETARLERRVHLLEAVRALGEDPLLEPDMQRLLERLAPAVRQTTGAEVIDAFLAGSAAARLFSAPVPNRQVTALLRRWARDPEAQPAVVSELLVVPMVVDGDVVGALRVRPGDDPDAGQLLLAVAAGIGGAVARVIARNRMAEHERGLAVAEERERVGRDLHDTLGQQLFALRVELEGIAASVTDRAAAARLREAVASVTRANADLRLAIHALSFLEHAKRGLVPSLRTLVRKIAETTDIGLQLKVVGTPVRLSNGCEEALFRVAHEALENVVRHSRASTAVVTVSFSPERTSLIVRDDGTGMSARSDEQRGLHFGLRTMQRRMEEIGGGLDVSNFRPHGVCLHAWVPTA